MESIIYCLRMSSYTIPVAHLNAAGKSVYHIHALCDFPKHISAVREGDEIGWHRYRLILLLVGL